MLELPSDFTHEPPENYSYQVEKFRQNVVSVWCCNHSEFSYNSGAVAKSIWGFYNTKQRTYYAPINSKKVGKKVNFSDTSPYTAMQKNYRGLEIFFM